MKISTRTVILTVIASIFVCDLMAFAFTGMPVFSSNLSSMIFRGLFGAVFTWLAVSSVRADVIDAKITNEEEREAAERRHQETQEEARRLAKAAKVSPLVTLAEAPETPDVLKHITGESSNETDK